MLKKRASAARSFNAQFDAGPSDGPRRRRGWADRALVDALIARVTGHGHTESLLGKSSTLSPSALRSYIPGTRPRNSSSSDGRGGGGNDGAASGGAAAESRCSAEQPPSQPSRSGSIIGRRSFTVSTISLSRIVARQRLKGVSFADKLKRKAGEDIAGAITTLVMNETRFLQAASEQHKDSVLDRLRAARECSGRMHGWLAGAEEAMRLHALWKHESEEEFADTLQELEAHIFEQLFEHLMRCAEDSDHDRALIRRLDLLAKFVTAEHLEAPALIRGAGRQHFLGAVESLRKTHECKSPRGMLSTVAGASRELVEALQEMAKASPKGASEDGAAAFGADDILPCMILAVLRATPPWFHTCLKFIEIYAPPSLLMGEGGYVLTQICSAKMFLERLDASNLHGIDEEVFKAEVAKAEDGGAVWEIIQDPEEEDDDAQEDDELSVLSGLSLDDYRREWTALTSPTVEEKERLKLESKHNERQQMVRALKQIFPDIAEAVISQTLEAQNGDSQRTAEVLLCSGGSDGSSVVGGATAAAAAQTRPRQQQQQWALYYSEDGAAYWYNNTNGEWHWANETDEEPSSLQEQSQNDDEDLLLPDSLLPPAPSAGVIAQPPRHDARPLIPDFLSPPAPPPYEADQRQTGSSSGAEPYPSQ